LIVTLALAASRPVRAQDGFQSGPGSQYEQGSILGYGSFGGRAYSPYVGAYDVTNGQYGAGYQPAAQLDQQAYVNFGPQALHADQPVFDAITALPNRGGNGSFNRIRRQRPGIASEISNTRAHLMDDHGAIRWPGALPDDPSLAQPRQAAEAAVKAVVQESKAKGHASIRPVIDAKKKLKAFAQAAIPPVKVKNGADADALDAFFSHLGKTLDTMALAY
jgi:hypothetical protein